MNYLGLYFRQCSLQVRKLVDDAGLLVTQASHTLAFAQWFQCLRRSLEATRYRRVIVIAGDKDWGSARAAQVWAEFAEKDCLWVVADERDCAKKVCYRKVGAQLGQEYHGLIFEAWAGLNPNAFGAASGTIQGSGVIVILAPPLRQWSQSGISPFHQRLAHLIHADEWICVVEQGKALPVLTTLASTTPQNVFVDDLYATPDQQRAVAALCKVATGRRRRPVVIVADRGRGKSAALGIAAAQLLQQGIGKIILTAPRLAATEAAFVQMQRLLPDTRKSRGKVDWQQGSIEFIPPDALCLQRQRTDLLLVDEAAAIPSPLLEKLLQRYARIAFVSTIHGYEGNGRGFAVRFKSKLDQITPGWKTLRLETPVRWGSGDPAERFTFAALLLNASAANPDDVAPATVDQLLIRPIDRKELAHNEDLLGELFGLLVLAHYRTTPGDLLQLLDATDRLIYIASWSGHIVAAVILGKEGQLSPELGVAIHGGQRRLKGHLIPQTLAAHAGLPEAVTLQGLRVIRIAVHPKVQHRGIGRAILAQVAKDVADHCDYLGASFGATPELLRFWKDAGYQLVRIGFTKNASSGEQSAVVLKPVNPIGAKLVAKAVARFWQQWVHWLADGLEDLEVGLVQETLSYSSPERMNPPELSSLDLRDLTAFANTSHSFDSCSLAIWKLAVRAVSVVDLGQILGPGETKLVIVKILQKKSWADVVAVTGMTGKAQAITSLRVVVGKLLRIIKNIRLEIHGEA